MFLAYDPHNMKTTGVVFLFIIFITSSVNVSQPWSLWDVGLCSSTVNTALSSKTPSLAQGLSEFSSGNGIPRSLSSSLKMFFNDGGFNTSLLTEKDYIITMEIEGEQLNSVEFSKKLEGIQLERSNIVFIIGGSYGLSPEIKAKSRLHLSVSKMTFPHQLFRVILLEQIYRAYKIMNNESYHK